ncbi:transcriptional regulator [Sodalis glossinidius]|uniref:transcriptional regulator n=1 Tax=Sodalis glossinidius TaxID=63612 RepID=UPI0009FFC4DD|nr:YdaS family helix-turn-helix protein [Sodalis glossinidius]
MFALNRAIRIAGTASKLAWQLDVSDMTVSKWKNKYRGIVPAERVLPIYRLTGVTPHELRPDLYPNPTDAIPSNKEHAA